jgi:ubiquinone biosynthesis protein COQ4
LPQVFRLIDALGGTAALRIQLGFMVSATGRELLQKQPDIVEVLADREALRRLPEGTLGRAYLAFVERENISAEGIRAASLEARQSQRVAFVQRRMRDTHDLWHALTGYHGDVAGELALLAFNVAQVWNTAIAVLVVSALIKGLTVDGGARLILDGFRRGLKAKWLPSQPWEVLLAQPIESVRAQLRVEPPPEYTPVRTTELRARGMVA